MIRIVRKVYVSFLSRTLEKGVHELPEAVEEQLLGTRYAEAVDSDQPNESDGDSGVELDLSADDESIKAVLEPLNAEQRDEIWANLDADAMADFLVERAEKERKNWQVQTMGNMIEKHVGL